MKCVTSTVVCLSVAMVGIGCEGTPQADRHRTFMQTREKREQELQSTIAMSEQYLAPYRTNGLVTFKVQPGGATLYINDGDIGTSLSDLLIPAGTYHVKAVWPDGKHAEKTIFVLPALQTPASYRWRTEQNDSGGKSNVDFNAPLHKTEIVLTKPE